ncbi:hypothetical protein QYQ99_03695 [Comamonas testosteroni]|uniref:hypothetical protein n=1 Tax=Comamonas TaxID=283 RepID=UPI0021139DC8|nr:MULTISPECIES: hypothetical protein [Comamonas]UUE96199.1 hypothetical protein MJ608_11435 [Comamonas thiooxydans]WKL16671.1 hypothetical protein QYQ99_03695 [Comamonas testosteroni]
MMNQAEVLRQIRGLTGPQAAKAYAKALNDTGFQVRRAMQDEMRAVFDRPTDYILRSPFVRMATAAKLSVTIEPTYMGGKGIDPQKILDAQTWGGRRRDKRSESALRRAGILPNGYQTAIPSDDRGGPYPGSDDGKGNLRGPFLVQLISYFHAFGEQGYKANMSEKGYQRVHRGTKKQAGRRYFVTYGKTRGGPRITQKGEQDERTAHLAPGIWAASGTGGADVRPVLMFVRPGRGYQPRFDMDKVAKRADAEAYLERRIRYRLREAAGV